METEKEQILSKLGEIFVKVKGLRERGLDLSCIHICPRYQWFLLKNCERLVEGKDVEPEVYDYALLETVWEKYLRQFLPAEVIYQREVELMGVKGTIDFFFPKSSLVLEVKVTTYSSLASKPDRHHICQVVAYMMGLKDEGIETPRGLLLYIPIDRPTLIFTDFLSPNPRIFSSKICRPIFFSAYSLMENVFRERAKEMASLIEMDEPPKWGSPNSEPCVNFHRSRPYICPFYDQCWGERGVLENVSRLIDDVGEWMEVYREIRRIFDPIFKRKRWVEEEIKERFRQRRSIGNIVVKGEKWAVVMTKVEKEFVDVDLMKRILDRKTLDRLIKRVRVIKVGWAKKRRAKVHRGFI